MQNLLKTAHTVLVLQKASESMDFILAIACVALIVLAGTSFMNARGIGSRIDKLVKEVRERPKKGAAQHS